MFDDANEFYSDISKWNVSEVRDISGMFNSASLFNGNLSLWDVSKVTGMAEMFNDARAFNQNLCMWNSRINNSTEVTNMFAYSACATTLDPSFGSNPIGPLCYSCY